MVVGQLQEVVGMRVSRASGHTVFLGVYRCGQVTTAKSIVISTKAKGKDYSCGIPILSLGSNLFNLTKHCCHMDQLIGRNYLEIFKVYFTLMKILSVRTQIKR